MNLTAEQVRNLNILADFMDGLNDPRFTMAMVNHSCGAPACAYGWARTIPKLIAAGIGETTHTSCDELFGDCYELFRGSLQRTIDTPQQWAAHCRAFLKANGYAVNDGFKTFMDRVMVPMDTGEISVAVKSQ